MILDDNFMSCLAEVQDKYDKARNMFRSRWPKSNTDPIERLKYNLAKEAAKLEMATLEKVLGRRCVVYGQTNETTGEIESVTEFITFDESILVDEELDSECDMELDNEKLDDKCSDAVKQEKEMNCVSHLIHAELEDEDQPYNFQNKIIFKTAEVKKKRKRVRKVAKIYDEDDNEIVQRKPASKDWPGKN